jgi:hypothetical protein
MTDLSPEAESLIAQASGGDDPSDLDEQRVRRQIATRLAAAAVAASAVAAPAHALSAQAGSAQALAGSAAGLAAQGATSAAAASGISSLGPAITLSKLILTLALGGGGAALGVQYFSDEPLHSSNEPLQSSSQPQQSSNKLHHSSDKPPHLEGDPLHRKNKPSELTKIDSRSVSVRARRESATTPSGAHRSAAPSKAAPSETTPLGTRLPAPSKQLESASTPRPRDEASPPAQSAVFEEASLLQRARSALARGQAAEAQKLLREHKQLYPEGALVEERRATQVLAECAHARTTHTDRRAAEFLSAYPRSPLASSVRQACSENRKQNDSFTDLPPLGH